MFPTYALLTFILLFSAFECLVQLENLSTEEVLQDTINKLFSSLQQKNINSESKFNQYSVLHKYFMSATLQGISKRDEVKNIVNVGNLNNITANLILTINDILNEGNTEASGNDFNYSNLMFEDDVILSIEYFLKELEYLKKEYKVDDVNVNINVDLLNRLRNLKPLNITNNIYNVSIESTVSTKEKEYWEPSGRRVYKGKRTNIIYYPFMASIHIFNTFQCAGSIISSDLVITACSCLQLVWNNRFYRENPAFLSVRIGSSHNIVGGEVISVLEVYFHPGYTPKTLKDNICVLRLTRHIIFKKKKRNVKKIIFDRNPHPLPINNRITIVGWGSMGSKGIIALQNRIQYSTLDFYPLKDCQDVYSRNFVTLKNFCAGFISKGGGACNKDVGGPGISRGILVGIVSFGPIVCGTPDAPTVFTKVGYYADWIQSIMEQDVSKDWAQTTLKSNFMKFPTPNSLIKDKISITTEPVQVGENCKNENCIPNVLRIIDKDSFQGFLLSLFDDKEIDHIHEMNEMDFSNNSDDYTSEESSVVTKKTTRETKKSSIVTKDRTYKYMIKDLNEIDQIYETNEMDFSNNIDDYSSEENSVVTKKTTSETKKSSIVTKDRTYIDHIHEVNEMDSSNNIDDYTSEESSVVTKKTTRETKKSSIVTKDRTYKYMIKGLNDIDQIYEMTEMDFSNNIDDYSSEESSVLTKKTTLETQERTIKTKKSPIVKKERTHNYLAEVPTTNFANDDVTEMYNQINTPIKEEYSEMVDKEEVFNDDEINQLISDIDLEKIIQQEVMGTDKITKLTNDPIFYLSDSKEESYEDSEEVMATTDTFIDLTRSRGNSTLRKAEILEALSESIYEQIQNKK